MHYQTKSRIPSKVANNMNANWKICEILKNINLAKTNTACSKCKILAITKIIVKGII